MLPIHETKVTPQMLMRSNTAKPFKASSQRSSKFLSTQRPLQSRSKSRVARSYRRYGTLAGHMNWVIGYNKEYAVRFGESLLWIGGPLRDVKPRETLPIAEENPLRSYELNNEVLFPSNVSIETARGLVVQSLITQIVVIAVLLRSWGRL